MNKENNKIIDEVKKFVNSNESKKEKVNLKKNDKIITNLVEEKVDSLDKTIQKEIKNWINLNAEEITKKVINEAVKKVFK